MFDAAFYLAGNSDVAAAGADPLAHYLHVGAAEGRSPHPLFDTAYYLAQYPDVAAAGANPLAHFLAAGAAERRNPHPLFDTEYYLRQPAGVAGAENPLLHYLRCGAAEGRNPHPLFDTSYYVELYSDVAASGINPLAHYVQWGILEGRAPFDGFDSSSVAGRLAMGGRPQPLREALLVLSDVAATADERRLASLHVVDELIFGQQPDSPEVSIVIPVYKSYYLIRQQLASLACDDHVRRRELIFVLDAPEDTELFSRFVRELWELYRVPLRVLVHSENGGFGRSCNTGARAARAPYLLLLNSDVFPRTAGWLDSMAACLEQDATVGVVGARLLNADGSIQHAGISWSIDEGSALYFNRHPLKGYPAALFSAEGAVEVPAVTGACMLMRTGDFTSEGMLDTRFVQGDYEDTDLCLRLRSKGKSVYCDHRAELYHLEASSFDPVRRRTHSILNAARHDARWRDAIEQFLSPGAPGITPATS